jgi:hypothetical protein
MMDGSGTIAVAWYMAVAEATNGMELGATSQASERQAGRGSSLPRCSPHVNHGELPARTTILIVQEVKGTYTR